MWRCCLKTPCISGSVWPCAQNPGTAASKLVSRKQCLPKISPQMQVGRLRLMAQVGWCRPPPPTQSQWQLGISPAPICSNRPGWYPWGSHGAGGNTSQVPAALTPHREPGQQAEPAESHSLVLEGEMGRFYEGWWRWVGSCLEGWGDKVVQTVGDCRKHPLHQVGLPWNLSLGRRKKQIFTSTSNTVIYWAKFLPTYKIPLQCHSVWSTGQVSSLHRKNQVSSFRRIFW